MPTTLTEIGVQENDLESLTKIAGAATVPGETIPSMPFEVRSGDVVSAFTSIERFALRVREDAHLPKPVPYVAHH